MSDPKEYAKILRIADGIQIIDDVTKQFSVDTPEGRYGPLMQGEGCRAHFLEQPPGLFIPEHPHKEESIIYTVRGKWVCSREGKRHVMEPGSLYWFGSNVPTGWEVPFDEPAFLLIFKTGLTPEARAGIDFVEHAEQMIERIEDHVELSHFNELAEDHPAQSFRGIPRLETGLILV